MIYPNIRIEMERGGFTVHQLAAIGTSFEHIDL